MIESLVHQLCVNLLLGLVSVFLFVLGIWWGSQRYPSVARPIAVCVTRWLFPDDLE